MERCLLCGKESEVNEQGICHECAEKLGADQKQEQENPRKETTTAAKSPYDYSPFEVKKEKCCISTNKLIKGLNKFYKFLHIGSILTSAIIFICWIFYLLFGNLNNLAEQTTAAESYARGAAQAMQNVSFNPHWNVPIIAILILIIGLFMSYILVAYCKWIELINK